MSYCHLTMDERNVIYRMRFQGYPDAEIARCIGCHRATIGREVKRNASVEGGYDPGTAQTLANSRRRAHLSWPKTGHRRLMAYVGEGLADHWSPEQIAGRVSACPPTDLVGLSISHTTIYRWIWGDRRRTQQFRTRPSLIAAAVTLLLALVTIPTGLVLTAKGQTQLLAQSMTGEKPEQPRYAARTFNSELAFGVSVRETDTGGWRQLGNTPGEVPLQIPACWAWQVYPRAPVKDWSLLARELSANKVPALALESCMDSDLKHLAD